MAAATRSVHSTEHRPGPARPRDEVVTLSEALDRILHKGVALEGEVTIGLADVELLYLDLRLLLASVDTIWPEGRSPLRPVTPTLPSGPGEPPSATAQGRLAGPVGTAPTGAHLTHAKVAQSPTVAADTALAETMSAAIEAVDPRGSTGMAPRGSPAKKLSTAEGLVQLVLTVVKLLHDVLERQAVRRMTTGNLTDLQIENVGAALFAQAQELERLRRHFDFSDQDLDLNLGRLQGSA